ncbi:polyketide synthase [Karstenula rhodostoma CBS 690.94]|uniref:Polyketide synthase n=1 Tax=Karstenula rhodostoma CBS 690.94 TaxID=1392251 RepID=A0A9P4PMC8_9PLEO|nr:polyketide synthase [Karstenula rhodostoma CBS 690.94]
MDFETDPPGRIPDEDQNLIAIVGMGCRWPGGICTPSQLWDFIVEQKSAYQDFSDARFNPDGFHHSNPQRPGSMQTRGAYLLEDDPKLFDHAFFGISGTEVATMDPAQRKLLEVVYEAFESAGETKECYAGSKTGVFVGNFNSDHLLAQTRDSEFSSPYSSTGAGASILSNRINFLMDLVGPSVTVDTACSSSLFALHLAVTAIRQGDCESAIVGGTNLIMTPDVQLMLTKLGALSPTSSCHTFDAAADGYARGEGFAALYIKKLSDAVKGDYPVRAVIRGTAINSNGRSAGLTHPSSQGQEAVIRQAYHNAQLDPKDTGYFEAHGTGTPVGDPIEVAAIGNVFATSTSDSPLLIGSIKPNIGHTEATSGLAGIMKAVLALEANLIPPTRGITALNPKVDFINAKVQVATESIPWPKDKIRRASINSFGYGGANAHCILDHLSVLSPGLSETDSVTSLDTNGSIETFATRSPHAPSHNRPRKIRSSSATTRRLTLLPFSANDEKALTRIQTGVLGGIANVPLADVAYTLACRRSKYRHRAYMVLEQDSVGGISVLDKGDLRRLQDVHVPTIAFVFTGQGAHWTGMGSTLFEYETFRNTIAYLDEILSRLSFAPNWKIQDILSGRRNLLIGLPSISQTVCTALQIGLVDLLRSWNITPTATIGHSSGEIAAAYCAGYVCAAEAIAIAYCRGVTVSKNERKGLMLAVGLGEDEVRPHLRDEHTVIQIAAVNSPESVTLSGDVDCVKSLSDLLHSQGIFTRILQTGGNAYHSSHMESLGLEYEVLLTQALQELGLYQQPGDKYQDSQITWISSVYPEIQFSAAVAKVLLSESLQVDMMVEIGPHSALKSPLAQVWADKRGPDVGRGVYHSALLRGHDGVQTLLQLCGSLFCANYQVDLVALNSEDHLVAGEHVHRHGRTTTSLPPYSFSYGLPIYSESRMSREMRLRNYARHDLLGSRLPGCSMKSPSWRNILRVKDVPWLEHHKLLPHTVFPASGYISMAIEAASQKFTEQHSRKDIGGYILQNVGIHTVMRVPEDDRGIEVMFNLEQQQTANGVSYRFRISSVTQPDAVWSDHCSGEIRPLEKGSIVKEFQPHEKIPAPSDPRMLNSNRWYNTFADTGIGYGPSFQAISDLMSDPEGKTVSAKIALRTTRDFFSGEESSYLLHPASLDACHQLAIVAGHQGHSENAQHAFVPVFFKRISLRIPEVPMNDFGMAICHSARRGIRGLYAQIQLMNYAGEPLMSIEDLHCVAYGEKAVAAKTPRRPYRNLVWRPDIARTSQDYANRNFAPAAIGQELVADMDKLDRLCSHIIMEIATDSRFQLNEPHYQPHIKAFLSWIRRSVDAEDPSLREAASACSVDRLAAISAITAQMQDKVEVQLIERIFHDLESIVSGTISGLEVALRDGLLGQFYTSSIGIVGAYPQLSQLVDLCAFRNPHMNILEIGAGTGGATHEVLKSLQADSSERLFNQYTFTDVSTAFLASAKSRFDLGTSMVFNTLDFERDPLEQGYEQQYDLVIASECLHTSRNVEQVLRHVRSLLKPDGQLLIVETTRTVKAHGLLLGTFPDYWVGEEDCRTDSPFLDESQWDSVLKRAGFSGIDLQLNDYPRPWSIASVFLSTCRGDTMPATSKYNDPIHLVSENESIGLCDLIASRYDQIGVPVTRGTQAQTGSGRAIYFLGSKQLTDLQHETWFESVKQLVQQYRSVVWITQSDVSGGAVPTAAVVMGLLRVISAENPQATHAIVDIQGDPESVIDMNLATQLFQLELDLQSSQKANWTEKEYVWKDGCLRISRLVPDHSRNDDFHLLHSERDAFVQVSLKDQKPFKVAYEKPGILSSTFFATDEQFLQDLPDDWIIARTEAVGLNWKDAAVALGRFDLNNASSEFSGVVTQIGSRVSGLGAGDRVYGIAFGHFGNYMRLPATFARRMPDTASFVDMATVPVVFASALHSLGRIARLQTEETVLIQSATGGLGTAAIQVAKSIGATIFATAGSEHKREYLHGVHGIPRSRIYSSREMPDVHTLLHITGGKGFDVVLSTSSGLNMDVTWSAMAPQGRFVDVGRVDVHQHGILSLEPFNRNATFSSFDLGRLDTKHLSELMSEVDQLIQAGSIQPISPVTEFGISQLGNALAKLSEGKHMGKLVVSYRDQSSLIRMTPSYHTATFDPNAYYLIAGGLGGLGRSLVTWMTTRGARYFISLSRKADITPEASSFIQNMQDRGIVIEPVACDITIRGELDSIVTTAASKRTVKGVVHMAMALRDKLFANLSLEEWQTGLSAKVQGTINLHDATLDIPLDFFVMASSVSTQIAQPTQAAYCAANSFQDYFSRRRRSQGLPATSIAFGLIHEVGELGRRIDVQNSMGRKDLYGTGEADFLRLVEAAFFPPQDDRSDDADPLASAHVVTSLEPALLLAKQQENRSKGITTTPRWHQDPRFSNILREMETLASSSEAAKTAGAPSSPSDSASLRTTLAACMRAGDTNEARRIVLSSIVNRVAEMLFVAPDTLDPGQGVSAYGIDSLVAAELRSWFIASYNSQISFLKLLDPSTSMSDLTSSILDEWVEPNKNV